VSAREGLLRAIFQGSGLDPDTDVDFVTFEGHSLPFVSHSLKG